MTDDLRERVRRTIRYNETDDGTIARTSLLVTLCAHVGYDTDDVSAELDTLESDGVIEVEDGRVRYVGDDDPLPPEGDA